MKAWHWLWEISRRMSNFGDIWFAAVCLPDVEEPGDLWGIIGECLNSLSSNFWLLVRFKPWNLLVALSAPSPRPVGKGNTTAYFFFKKNEEQQNKYGLTMYSFLTLTIPRTVGTVWPQVCFLIGCCINPPENKCWTLNDERLCQVTCASVAQLQHF